MNEKYRALINIQRCIRDIQYLDRVEWYSDVFNGEYIETALKALRAASDDLIIYLNISDEEE